MTLRFAIALAACLMIGNFAFAQNDIGTISSAGQTQSDSTLDQGNLGSNSDGLGSSGPHAHGGGRFYQCEAYNPHSHHGGQSYYGAPQPTRHEAMRSAQHECEHHEGHTCLVSNCFNAY